MRILALRVEFTSVVNILTYALMSPAFLTSLKNRSVQLVLNSEEFYM